MKFKSLVLTALLLMSTFLAGARDVPALTGRVNDYANVLKADEKQQLDAILLAHEKETSNQIVILTIPSLEGEDKALFGQRVGQTWGIGQKGKNNGVVIIISINDHKFFIATGYGVEGPLPDLLCNQIFQTVVPDLRAGHYAVACRKVINHVIAAIKGEYKASPGSRVSGQGVNNQAIDDWNKLKLMFQGVILVFGILIVAGIGSASQGWGAFLGFFLGFLSTVLIWGVGPFSFPFALVLGAICALVGWYGQTVMDNIPSGGGGGSDWGGGSSGGSDGGFSGGGGAFGGGGGGGDW